MSSNMERYGKVLSDRMRRAASAAVPIAAELGRINENLSLTPDSLRIPIPKGDYLVDNTLTGVLQMGDRVLLIWCGNDPVVVSIVVNS